MPTSYAQTLIPGIEPEDLPVPPQVAAKPIVPRPALPVPVESPEVRYLRHEWSLNKAIDIVRQVAREVTRDDCEGQTLLCQFVDATNEIEVAR